VVNDGAGTARAVHRPPPRPRQSGPVPRHRPARAHSGGIGLPRMESHRFPRSRTAPPNGLLGDLQFAARYIEQRAAET
jgi:hypothetical protein